jgi:hypothetical protein
MPRGLASPLLPLVALDRYLLRQGRWLRAHIIDASAAAIRLLPCIALAVGIATDTPGSRSSSPFAAAAALASATAQFMASTFADETDLSDSNQPAERTRDAGTHAAVERSAVGAEDTACPQPPSIRGCR